MNWIAIIAAVIFSLIAQGSWANVVLFQRVTDTIQLGSPTTLGTAATLEARILHTPAFSGGNGLFREWVDSVTDKNLAVTPSSIAVELHDVAPTLSAPATINPNVWHHIAAVYDGASLSLYLDGVRVATVSASGSIANGNSRPIFGGGKFEDYWPIAGFVGYVDWFRMSNVARYSGATFAAPTGQPANDSNTVLLFYFDEAPGSITAADQSSYRNNGTLGAGVSGATRPVFTSDPLVYPSPPPDAAAVPTLADTMLMCLAASLGVAGGLLVRRRMSGTSA